MLGLYFIGGLVSTPYICSRVDTMSRYRREIQNFLYRNPERLVSFREPNYIIQDRTLYKVYSQMLATCLWPVAIPYLEYSSQSYKKMNDELWNHD